MSPYELLGIPEDAPSAVVTAAYRRLAKETHPDLNPGDGGAAARFSEVRRAYEAIVAMKAHAAGRASRSYEEANSRGRNQTARDGFGHAAATRRDVRKVVSIGLAEAFVGGTIRIAGSSGRCSGCSGEGFHRTKHRVTCHVCLGSGISGYAEKGIIRVKVACPECAGTGHAMKMLCEECLGEGTSTTAPAEIIVPPGCSDGASFLVKGGANDPVGGFVGDLLVVIAILPHPAYAVSGRNLETLLTIESWEAAMGADVFVPGLASGGFRLTVPPGTQSGRKFRLKGRGMPGEPEPGDLIVVIDVRIPNAERGPVRAAFDAVRQATLGQKSR